VTPAPGSVGLLLAPGAGADRTQAALVAVDEAVARTGVVVERMDFPYRRAGRRAPDRAPVLVRAVVEEAARLAGRVERIVLGGRSMGGRMASMAVADGLPAAGLVLISYPLHPPGRPDRPRTAHLPGIGVPCLFVSGTRDAFASVDELEAATATVAGPVTHRWLEGGDHGLRRCDAGVAEVVAAWLASTPLTTAAGDPAGWRVPSAAPAPSPD
jgi:predicted alpha/beta-hydrolase family hydrolase